MLQCLTTSRQPSTASHTLCLPPFYILYSILCLSPSAVPYYICYSVPLSILYSILCLPPAAVPHDEQAAIDCISAYGGSAPAVEGGFVGSALLSFGFAEEVEEAMPSAGVL